MIRDNAHFKRPSRRIGSPQEQQRWQWEAEQAAQWAGCRELPADHPLVAADVVAGQAEDDDLAY